MIMNGTLLLTFLSIFLLSDCSDKENDEYPLLPYPPVVVGDNYLRFNSEGWIKLGSE